MANENGSVTTGNETGAQTTESQVSAPQQTAQSQPSGPLSLKDDSLVTYEGAKEPIQFGKLRGLQSQFTKVSQERAKIAKTLQEREARLEQLERAFQGYQTQNRPDPFGNLKELPYLRGEEAHGAFANISQELAKRDQIFQLMAAKMLQQEQILQNLNRTHSNQSFDSKIKGFLSQLDLDEDYEEMARVFYLAHEGDDLDQEFPELFKKFLDKQKSREEARTARRKEEARRRPFVPSKGGLTSASKELDFAGKSAKEQTDMLWDALQSNKT